MRRGQSLHGRCDLRWGSRIVCRHRHAHCESAPAACIQSARGSFRSSRPGRAVDRCRGKSPFHPRNASTSRASRRRSRRSTRRCRRLSTCDCHGRHRCSESWPRWRRGPGGLVRIARSETLAWWLPPRALRDRSSCDNGRRLCRRRTIKSHRDTRVLLSLTCSALSRDRQPASAASSWATIST